MVETFLKSPNVHMHGAFKEAVSLNDVAINQVSQDDNVATGSSYQYVDWSKPSKDGWMAVQNPHLRMFSQVMCHITKEPSISRLMFFMSIFIGSNQINFPHQGIVLAAL